MAQNYLYKPRVLDTAKPVQEVGLNFSPTFFLPVTLGTIKFIRGMLDYLDEPIFWEGTESEVEAVREVIRRQIAEPIKTQAQVCGAESYGADYRVILEDILQSQQGGGLPPPPWEFRVVPQEDGSVLLQYRTEEGN